MPTTYSEASLVAWDGTRLFVVEQPGRIRVIRDGELLDTPFLDIADRVIRMLNGKVVSDTHGAPNQDTGWPGKRWYDDEARQE